MKAESLKKQQEQLERVIKTNPSDLEREQLLAMVHNPLLTNEHFMTIFNIKPKTAYRWRKRKLINHIPISRRVYYQWKDVIELLKTLQSIQPL